MEEKRKQIKTQYKLSFSFSKTNLDIIDGHKRR